MRSFNLRYIDCMRQMEPAAGWRSHRYPWLWFTSVSMFLRGFGMRGWTRQFEMPKEKDNAKANTREKRS
jgi:hypothetical protein